MATFNGGSGDDNYTGTPGFDTANGNGGDDTLDGADDNDTLIGGSGSDTLIGGNGRDVLFSHAVDAFWWPSASPYQPAVSYDIYAEVDVLSGGAGDDALFVGYGDSADGGDHVVTGDKLFISFRGAPAGVNADFRPLGSQASVTIEGGTYTGIEEVVFIEGTDFADVLGGWVAIGYSNFGRTAGNIIFGYGGNDTIYASASSGLHGVTAYGNSGLYGGDGDDVIDDTASRYGSRALGEAGDDHIFGGAAYGNYHGGDGNDALEGYAGNDGLHGDAGNDVLDGGSGRDNLFGGADNDTLYGAGDDDVIEGGDGDDILHGDFSLISSTNEFLPNNNDDILRGDAGADTLYGNQGNDVLDGGTGADTMRGGVGNDSYYIDDAGDVVEENAGEGTDELRIASVSFSLIGWSIENLTAANDVAHDFRGNAGDNVLTGGAGDDLLRLDDGGNDGAVGGAGNDVILFGATMTASDSVDGGTGRDQIAIQGNYAITFGPGIAGVESIAILNGADTRFGDPGTNSYDYNLTTVDSNVAAGMQMIVDASGLRPGEDLTFNGSAETNGSFFIYGGNGVDTLTGGARNDAFYFGEGMQWGASDVLNGGPGGIDQLGLRGNYSITFGANQLVGIENIGLVSAQDTRFGPLGTLYNYNLTMHDGNVASGVQLTLDAFALRGGETLTFNGAAETNGSFRVFGGQGFDTITGGQGNDIIAGHAGPDWLTGGPGADQFRYYRTTDSIGATDLILDFTPGTDKIDLIRIDANTHAAGDQAFHWIGSNAFGAAGAASAGELRATFNSGNGSWLVQGDTNGDGSADIAITLYLQGPTPLGAGDFFL